MASKLSNVQSQESVADAILLRKGPFDAKDELESTLFDSFTRLQMQLKPPYQLHSRSGDDLMQLNQALVYGILTQKQAQQSHVMHLAAVTRDGYAGFVSIVLCLVKESYTKLLDKPREHLLWLVRQLINFAAVEMDTLCLSLLRCVVGGDTSPWNIWLASQMLDILCNNWSWLVEHSSLLTGALFAYLRLIPDHYVSKSPVVSELKKDEVAFCVKILRDRFQDCLVIGRDLVRLLQDVATIPEFELIWKDLLLNPAAFNAVGFADIAQLYVVCTPARYLTSRLTHEMEAQIRFMLTHVRMGSQLRYQAWFAQRYFTSPGNETMDGSSNVAGPITLKPMQSWLFSMIGFFFIRKTDNIMNVEPALLLMIYSIPRYMDITQSLLEFLFLCMEQYDPQRKDLIWCGVTASIDILVEKGVVQSLKPLSSSPHIAISLRKKLNEYFPTYCHVFNRGANCGPSLEDIPETHPVPVLAAQSSPSKQSIPTAVEADSVVGDKILLERERGLASELTRDALVDTSGSSTSTKQNKPSPRGISTIHPVLVLAAQSSPSKQSTPTIVEADRDVGGHSFLEMERGAGCEITSDALGTTMGSPIRKKQNILSEEAGSPTSPGNTRAVESMSTKELKGNALEIISCKKRRLNLVTLDDLSKSMNKLREESVIIFEEFLSLHLSDPGEIDVERNLKETAYCGPENYEVMAKIVTSIMKGSNFHFFAPLRGPYSDCLEEDEIKSVTSAVLRRYTQSSHPGLLNMLFSWHSEGCAVGARLLCYSCRLAEHASPFITSVVAGLNAEKSNHSFQKQEKKLETLAEQHRKASALSALSWHQELHHVANMYTLTNEKVETVHSMELHSVAMGCFMAYNEFLKGLKNKQQAPCAQLVSMDAAHQENLTEKQAVHELQSLLVKDLEICLSWSRPRLQSILPFVFSYLPELSGGNEKVIRLLVSTMTPKDLSKLELKLSLKEISVFGGSLLCIQTLFRNSLSWDSFEQQYFWRLLVAEWQNSTSLSLSEFVKYCKLFLKPDHHYEALSGLLSLLRVNSPTVILVSTLLHLPEGFNKLVAAVLATWTKMHTSLCLECLTACLSSRLQEEVESPGALVCCLPQNYSIGESSLSKVLDFLNNLLEASNSGDENIYMDLRKIQKILSKMLEKSHLKL